MKLVDISHGPDWLVWVAFVVLAVCSVVLISGHGSGLISGYNTASKEEKAKYDAVKLCRVTGIGMAVITVLIFVMKVFEDVLPADFVYVSLGIIVVDCLAIIVVSNTMCRK